MAGKCVVLTCPWCGAVPVVAPWHGGGKRKTMVACDNDTCEVRPGMCGATRKEAVARWNTRIEAKAVAVKCEKA